MSVYMIVHIITGTVAVCSGFIALFSLKGSTIHRIAGRTFFFSMLIMASLGAIIALQVGILIATIAGVFTCYLVLTSWAAIAKPATAPKRINQLAPWVAGGIAVAGIYLGQLASASSDNMHAGYHAASYYFFGGLALWTGLFDTWILLRRQTLGFYQRLIRHLWRMCLGLFLAAGSLFTGPGAQAFPEAWQGSAWLSVPENTVLLVMLIYILLLTWQKWRRYRATDA
ncbi:hypothetical protein QWI17_02060 [Gilvimarinus sp. SDUM040013]|uniref:DUF2306 domain-containing protein n=1 Tax=Gilvimarinus gilvus TaxID=3058038 RepID=A0ABU4RZ91_9GAMM|nr:hypothetical protein [Gilvimarinus sp. SDUM040013]MDO3384615.1 hypothetical protein [Gilvimarinus sp. SDUM040013]MDX6850201.1 hypothetical protein [Gilvimarinus sp. SDUM040013]